MILLQTHEATYCDRNILLLTNKIALLFHKYKQTQDQIYLRLSVLLMQRTTHKHIVYNMFIVQQLLVLLLLTLSFSGRSRMLSDEDKGGWFPSLLIPSLFSINRFQSINLFV